jgi:hypothetical protein
VRITRLDRSWKSRWWTAPHGTYINKERPAVSVPTQSTRCPGNREVRPSALLNFWHKSLTTWVSLNVPVSITALPRPASTVHLAKWRAVCTPGVSNVDISWCYGLGNLRFESRLEGRISQSYRVLSFCPGEPPGSDPISFLSFLYYERSPVVTSSLKLA